MNRTSLLTAAVLAVAIVGCSSGEEPGKAAVDGAPATSTPQAQVDPQNVRRPPDREAMRRKFMENAAKGGPPPAPGGM